MDRIAYIAAGGAARTLEHQAMLTNNMANVNTTGFRAQLAAYRSVPLAEAGQDPGKTTRVSTIATTGNSTFQQGAFQSTGRDLDVAIKGDGWFAVQTPDGEGYTRAGNFQTNANGQLITSTGRLVLSQDGQPIDLAGSEKIAFDRNGGINAVPAGGRGRDMVRIAQLKLVSPPTASLVRGDDGLFRSMNAQGQAQPVEANPNVVVQGKALEGSNVSAAESMVGLIQNARRFEMQMKVIADASQNEQKANSILSSAN